MPALLQPPQGSIDDMKAEAETVLAGAKAEELGVRRKGEEAAAKAKEHEAEHSVKLMIDSVAAAELGEVRSCTSTWWSTTRTCTTYPRTSTSTCVKYQKKVKSDCYQLFSVIFCFCPRLSVFCHKMSVNIVQNGVEQTT